jgi:excisionase family DNA binding protein
MFLTIPEVARHLSVSDDLVRNLVKKGSIPSCKFGRVIRIEENDLLLFIDRTKLQSATKACAVVYTAIREPKTARESLKGRKLYRPK